MPVSKINRGFFWLGVIAGAITLSIIQLTLELLQ